MSKRTHTEQRWLVFHGRLNGAGDRLNAAITVFYMALLTGRAFRIKWAGPPLDCALQPRSIDWKWQSNDTDPQYGTVSNAMQMAGGGNRAAWETLWLTQNLSDYNSESRAIQIELDRGQLNRLFQNPHYRDTLRSMGLRVETAYGCAADYLFRIHPELIGNHTEVWQSVSSLSDPTQWYNHKPYALHPPGRNDEIIIGLQIRYPDTVMVGMEPCDTVENMAFARQYLECGQNLQAQLQTLHNKPVRFFLTTNCVPLKQAWASELQDEMIIDNSFKPRHTLRLHQNEIEEFRNIMSDMLLFGLCDYFIIGDASQFGKTGALLSLTQNSTWLLMSWDPIPQPEPPNCTLDNYTPFASLAQRHLQVRRNQPHDGE